LVPYYQHQFFNTKTTDIILPLDEVDHGLGEKIIFRLRVGATDSLLAKLDSLKTSNSCCAMDIEKFEDFIKFYIYILQNDISSQPNLFFGRDTYGNTRLPLDNPY
jgi:hypothetical protein